MQVFLHIGIWKTGSTAIQTFLSQNADQLAGQGVLIPSYARDMKRYNHLFERLVAEDEGGVTAIEAELANQVAATAPEKLIISSEHFWHAPPHVIDRVAAMLRRLSDDIRVIAYVRPQDEMWASLYAQQAKFFRVRSDHAVWGNGDYIGPAIADNAMFYHQCLEEYRRVFGGDAVELRRYDRTRFPRNDVVFDFLDWVGVKDVADLAASDRDENSSFGWKGVSFSIWLADRLHAGLASFENTKAAGKALRFALRDTGREFDDLGWYGKAPNCFNINDRRRIRAHYAEDTQLLSDRYFGGEAPFDPPSNRAADPSGVDLIPQREFDFARKRLRQRIASTYPLFSAKRWRLATEER